MLKIEVFEDGPVQYHPAEGFVTVPMRREFRLFGVLVWTQRFLTFDIETQVKW